MARLFFKEAAATYFGWEFPGFIWVSLVGSRDHVVHVFEKARTGQRMLVEVLADNSWSAYTHHASKRGNHAKRRTD